MGPQAPLQTQVPVIPGTPLNDSKPSLPKAWSSSGNLRTSIGCYIIQASIEMSTSSPAIPKAQVTADTCAVPCFNEQLVSSIKRWLPESVEVRSTAALYGALADPTRLRILMALTEGELCVCDVAHVLELSVAAASHQLRLLRNLGVLKHRTDGRMAYYSLCEEGCLKDEIGRALALHRPERSADG